MTTIKNVEESFHLLYDTFDEPSADFKGWEEKSLLPNIRFFLLGYFGKELDSAMKAMLLSTKTGADCIDFVVGNTAIEFAFRLPDESKSKLTSYTNRDERAKLIRRKKWHPGLERGVHVLFDFSNNPLSTEQLEEYRELPDFGSGNFNKDGFSILYFHRGADEKINCIRKKIAFK